MDHSQIGSQWTVAVCPLCPLGPLCPPCPFFGPRSDVAPNGAGRDFCSGAIKIWLLRSVRPRGLPVQTPLAPPAPRTPSYPLRLCAFA